MPSSITDNLRARTAASLSRVARDSLEPTRRVELPLDGLRDRYTAVVLRGHARAHGGVLGSGAGDRSRTDLSLCGAQSCHLDSPAWRCVMRTCYSSHRRRYCCVRRLIAWIGSDSNRRFVWVRTRCNPVLLPIHLGRRSRAARAGTIRQRNRPTLWNRTRTSRASARRADQLRKSGIRAPRTGRHRERILANHPQPCAAQIIIIVLQLSESGARRAHLGPSCGRVCSARTSGVSASDCYADAPFTIRDLD